MPRTPDKSYNRVLMSVRVPPPLKKKIEENAEKENLTVSKYINAALVEKVEGK